MERRINDMTQSYSCQRRLHSSLLGHRVRGFQRLRQPVVRATPAAPVVPSSEQPEPVVSASRSPEELQRQAELERELQLARDIQQGLLLAAAPHLPGWELSAVSLPARDLGGDLYDFLPLAAGWQGIMIGDVAGKGLPAALQMAVTRTVFRHEARRGEAPAATLAAVNQGVLSEIPRGMVTMLYALLEPKQGILRMSNAGHTFPLLVNGNVQELEVSGLPLGVDLESDYEEMTVVLEPGDSIVLYSDGVTEALNADYAMFGLERLQELLAGNRQLKPRAIVSLLLHELRTWSADQGQSDDVTMVVLRRRMATISAELRSIVTDVLGADQSEAFWEELVALHSGPLEEATVDGWIAVLPELARLTQSRFGRGLARELNQQLRLAIEDYRIQNHAATL